jgi:hypothetical protein
MLASKTVYSMKSSYIYSFAIIIETSSSPKLEELEFCENIPMPMQIALSTKIRQEVTTSNHDSSPYLLNITFLF